MREGGLTEHLTDAIRLNRARRAGYVAKGGARAGRLSRTLVALERSLLPAARVLDHQAAPFWDAGIPVVRADVASMSAVGRADAPPRYLAGDPDAARRQARTDLSDAVGEARRQVRRGELAEAGRVLTAVAGRLREVEAAQGVHLALTEHLVATAAVAAAHGAAYSDATAGRSVPVSSRLVAGTLAFWTLALALDRWAHPIHARGVGLFVNDVPPVLALPAGLETSRQGVSPLRTIPPQTPEPTPALDPFP